MGRYFLITSLVLVFSSPEIVHSQATTSEELYQEGKQAYYEGDCVTAIEKLSAFRARHEDKIDSYKTFFVLIDEKIETCKAALKKGTTPAEIRGTRRFGG